MRARQNILRGAMSWTPAMKNRLLCLKILPTKRRSKNASHLPSKKNPNLSILKKEKENAKSSYPEKDLKQGTK